MMNVPKFVRVNVHNLPDGVLQTSYYAHSAELIGDCLVVDVRVDDPIPTSSNAAISLNDPMSIKYDLAPLRRPINLRRGTATAPVIIYDTEVEDTEIDDDMTQDAQGDNFADLDQLINEEKSNETQHTLIASEDEEDENEDDEEDTQETIGENQEEYRKVKKRRVSRNRDKCWVQKRRKVRKDKGKPRGIECEVCMSHRELLHTCRVCKHSFCKFCFERLVGHDYEVDVCSVCKRNF